MSNHSYQILLWQAQVFLLEHKRWKIRALTSTLYSIQRAINLENRKISCNVT